MAAQPHIGIDLGTTNSVVAMVDAHGRPTVLANGDGDLLTPSVVYFDADGPAIVGREAVKAGLQDPGEHGRSRQARTRPRVHFASDSRPQTSARRRFRRDSASTRQRRRFPCRRVHQGGRHRSRVLQRAAAESDDGRRRDGRAQRSRAAQRTDGGRTGVRLRTRRLFRHRQVDRRTPESPRASSRCSSTISAAAPSTSR